MSYTTINKEFKLHTVLKANLDIAKKENRNDWDFKMLFSGDGMTRTGKSTLGSQVASYIDPTFTKNWKERMIFQGEQLIDTAYEVGKNKALVYDEARKGLDNKKQMERYTKNLMDFLSECGNLNQFIIVILPDYFELPKSLAITQSIFLINCYARDGFRRGYFDFFNRKDKKYLYIKGSKYLNYQCQKPSFKGTFTNYMPFNRKEYEKLKTNALKEMRRKDSPTKLSIRLETHKNRVTLLIKELCRNKYTKKEIAEVIGVSKANIFNTYLKNIKGIKGLKVNG